jgi:chromosome segregation ATPase
VSSEDGATYRVPSFRVAELDADKRAAKAARQEAQGLDAQVERQKIILNDEKRRVEQAERQLDVLGSEIDQRRSLVDSSNQYEVDSYNSKIREYNQNRAQLRRRIDSFNIDVNTYNDLVQRAQAKEQRANHMVDIYNSKLEQYGTRQ